MKRSAGIHKALHTVSSELMQRFLSNFLLFTSANLCPLAVSTDFISSAGPDNFFFHQERKVLPCNFFPFAESTQIQNLPVIFFHFILRHADTFFRLGHWPQIISASAARIKLGFSLISSHILCICAVKSWL